MVCFAEQRAPNGNDDEHGLLQDCHMVLSSATSCVKEGLCGKRFGFQVGLIHN